VYAEIGRQIERNGLDVIHRRAFVSGQRKLALIARAATAAVVAPAAAKARLPILPAVQFLVDAAAASPPRRSPVARSFDERVGWVIQLCERQSMQQRVSR
jgi:phytoene synthase